MDADEPDICEDCGQELDPTIELRQAMISTAVEGAQILDVALMLTGELGELIGSMSLRERGTFRKLAIEMLDAAIKDAVVAACDA